MTIKSSNPEDFAQANAVATIVGNHIRESVGWELLEERHIQCRNCDKHICSVIKVKESGRPVKIGMRTYNIENSEITVNCPYCEDKSFVSKIDGEVCIGHADGAVISNIDVEVENDVTMKVKVYTCKEK